MTRIDIEEGLTCPKTLWKFLGPNWHEQQSTAPVDKLYVMQHLSYVRNNWYEVGFPAEPD
jgi:hypothetical protein